MEQLGGMGDLLGLAYVKASYGYPEATLDGSCRRTVKVDRRKNTLTIGCRVELYNVAG